MSTYRLTILGVLAVVAAFYGYYLLQQSQQPAVPPKAHTIIADVLPDGAVSIDGKRYDDPARLKARLATIRTQYPKAEVHVRAPAGAPFEQVGKAAVLLQNAGETGMSFVTEPANAPAPANTPAPVPANAPAPAAQ